METHTETLIMSLRYDIKQLLKNSTFTINNTTDCNNNKILPLHQYTQYYAHAQYIYVCCLVAPYVLVIVSLGESDINVET